jgi:hypothetical protein
VVTFSGSGTLTWGIDLDTTANSGFKNEYASAFKVQFVAASTESKGSADDGMVYGAITLSGMALAFDTANNKTVPLDMAMKTQSVDVAGVATNLLYVYAPDADTMVIPSAVITAPTVAAYVQLGPVQWLIYSAPDLLVDYTTAALEDDADDNFWTEDDEADGVDTDFGAGATGLRYKNDMLTVTAKIASSTDWTAAGKYGAGLDAAVTISPITLNAGFCMPFDGSNVVGFGGKVAVAISPISAYVAFDGKSAGAFLYQMRANVTVTLASLLSAMVDVAMSDATTAWGIDAEVGVNLLAVPNLTFGLVLGLWDVTTALEWGVKVDANYKVMMGETNYVKPFVTTYVSDGTEGAMRIYLIGGVEAMLFPRTVFTLKYLNKDLTDSDSFAGQDSVLTFATKVSY